jgi:hypothetical protein
MGATPSTDPSGGRSLTFAVSGGNPRVDLAVRADEDGSFVADVLTERSLAQSPPVRLGSFRGRLPAATIDALAAVAAASLGPAGSAGPVDVPPGAVVRLVSAGGATPVPAVGEETDLAALDRAIAEAAASALGDPVSAILTEAREGDGGPVLALKATGTEPFRLLLFASDIPGYWARTWIDTPAGQRHLELEAVERLVAAGTVADGPADLAPGSEAVLPLPEGATAGSTGGFIVWRAGQGPERRIVTGSWSLAAPGS